MFSVDPKASVDNTLSNDKIKTIEFINYTSSYFPLGGPIKRLRLKVNFKTL